MSTKTLPESLAFIFMAFLMLAADAIALLLINPVKEAGITAFSNPDTLWNVIIFLIVLLAVTAILLVLIKHNAQIIISILLAVCLAAVIFYVSLSLLVLALSGPIVYVLAAIIGVGILVLLWFYPEWYIINIVGIIASAGCAVIFGVSLSPLPVIILLILMVIYDYIAVHRTKHMLKLADGVMNQKIPIMFIVPKTSHYSYRKSSININDDKSERSAYMIGMGDMIMPAILIISAQVYVPGIQVLGLSLPALGTIIGSIVGLLLLRIPMKSGKAEAGLPFINTFAIIGFVLCCLISNSWSWITVVF